MSHSSPYFLTKDLQDELDTLLPETCYTAKSIHKKFAIRIDLKMSEAEGDRETLIKALENVKAEDVKALDINIKKDIITVDFNEAQSKTIMEKIKNELKEAFSRRIAAAAGAGAAISTPPAPSAAFGGTFLPATVAAAATATATASAEAASFGPFHVPEDCPFF